MDVVQICNMALARCNGQAISDIDADHSKSASLCRVFYEPARDATLEDGDWTFALARQALATSAITNQSIYQYVYALPSSPYCVRPIKLLALDYSDSILGYEVIGRFLYTNEPGALLHYMSRVTDVTQFSASYMDALAWRLAAEIIGPLTGESPANAFALYQQAIIKALGVDAQGSREAAAPAPRIVDERFRRRVM